MQEAQRLLGANPQLTLCEDEYSALEGCDALLLITEWRQFRYPDFAKIKLLLNTPVIFDGRNQYDPAQVRAMGFSYYGVGRP